MRKSKPAPKASNPHARFAVVAGTDILHTLCVHALGAIVYVYIIHTCTPHSKKTVPPTPSPPPSLPFHAGLTGELSCGKRTKPHLLRQVQLQQAGV